MKVKVSALRRTLLFATVFALGLVILLATVGGSGEDTDIKGVSEDSSQVSQQNNDASIETVSVSQFAEEVKQEGAVVLDIRTPEEYERGQISGAKNIDFYSDNFESELTKLDRSAKYKIYCNSGNRSATTLNMMREMGFNDVVELQGGIQAWKSGGNPTCTSC
jgi:rhodanese-related sulfurtransferase